AVPMLLVAVFRRRFWCRRLCPVGLISEYCGRVRGGRIQQNAQQSGLLAWPAGRAIVLVTLGGALAGYPFLLWMDPLALFSGAFNLSRAGGHGMTLLSAAGLPAVMFISFLFPGIWCSRICPLGATQDLLALVARGFNRGTLPAATVPARRAILAVGAGAAFCALVPKAWARKQRYLRPPGNVDETTFKGGCVRCGSCVRVCPAGIIQPVVDPGDVSGLLAPTLRFSGPNYCLQDCNRCGKACPTKVIRRLPLREKNRHVFGIARIDLSRCLLRMERECGVCLPRCPRGAIVEGFDYDTYTVAVKVLPDKCNGCGACVGICPAKVVTIDPGSHS
ncbi:MAG: 4Fe-4S dicluster domain-containing protein, partial [Acidobacteriales bacterium]|nr:4Fe-4S dicluster domain-containing protein [Terriglobales bacterium]